MLLVAAIPVLVVGALTIGSLIALSSRADDRLGASRSELTQETIAANHAEQARLVLARMDSFVDERLSDVIDWSRSDMVVDTAGAAYPELTEISEWPSTLVDSRFDPAFRLDQSGRADRWLDQQIGDRDTFVGAIITNANGLTVGAAQAPPDFTNDDQEWWLRAWNDGAYVGPVETADISGVSSFDVAVRITDPATNQPVGVVRGSVSIAALQPLADEFNDATIGREVRVLTADGLLLAETSTNHDPDRISTRPTFESSHDEAYDSALADAAPTGYLILDDVIGGYSRTSRTRAVSRLDTDVASPSWVAFVEQPASAALEPLSGLESLRSDLGTTTKLLTLVIAAMIIATLALAFLLARLLANRIVRPLNQLRVEANRLADRELPELIDSLHSPTVTGEIPRVTPIDIDADGEVAELATAFNSVRSTAVELAAAQAIGRTRDVSNILLNLGRRNQHLVGRQLRFIDELERTESDADVLRNLFILDQMATRMRRNAESLLVLAGEESPRRVNRPRPIEEVIRAATGEVEDYARVQIAEIDEALIQPMVVNDLTHLLAELIENATNFSPPEELVHVVGTPGEDGSYTLSIIDHGIGIPVDQLRGVNHRLQDGIFTSETTSSFLGLHVVGRLAIRHRIDVRLEASMPTGITAEVTLPATCIAGAPIPARVDDSNQHRGVTVERGQDPRSWGPPAIKPRPAGLEGREAELAPANPPFVPANITELPAVTVGDDEAIEATARVGAATSSATGESAESDFETEPESAESSDPTTDLRAAVAEATDNEQHEDESEGLPIPPFRARESNRPAGLPMTQGGDFDALPLQDHGAEGPPDRFQVRRRIRRHTADGNDALEPVTPDGIDGPDTPDRDIGTITRAAEVRDKLNRFANGVEAAKTAAVTAPPTDQSNGVSDGQAGGDVNSTDNESSDEDDGGGLIAFRRLGRRSKRGSKRR